MWSSERPTGPGPCWWREAPGAEPRFIYVRAHAVLARLVCAGLTDGSGTYDNLPNGGEWAKAEPPWEWSKEEPEENGPYPYRPYGGDPVVVYVDGHAADWPDGGRFGMGDMCQEGEWGPRIRFPGEA